MSDAIAGVGAEFHRWDNSGWQKISEVRSISGPSKARETIDVTNLDSQGGYREFKGSFRDGGTVDLVCNFTRDAYEVLNNDFESDDLQDYEIILPDPENTTLEFQGMVTEIPLDISPDDAVTFNVSIKVSGEPTLNSGSGSGA